MSTPRNICYSFPSSANFEKNTPRIVEGLLPPNHLGIFKPSFALQTKRNLTLTVSAHNQRQHREAELSRLGIRSLVPGEDTLELPVNALGSSAKVLVLTDAAQRSKQRKFEAAREKPKIEKDVLDGPSPADLLHYTEDKRRSLDTTEIHENLQELHKTFLRQRDEDGFLPQQHYEEAKEALRSGFTYKQLIKYLRDFRSRIESSNLNGLTPQPPALYIRHPWIAGVSSFPETALARLEATEKNPSSNEALDDTQHRSLRRNQVIDNILCQCWAFKTQEELGELDLRISHHIRDLFFSLHRNADSSLFAKIAKEYGARIDASHSTGLLRITASYRSSQDTLRLIEFALEQFRSDTFEISLDGACDGVTTPNIPAAQLETIWANIGRHNNTTISASRSGEWSSTLKLTVWSMGPSDTDFLSVQRLIARAIESFKEKRIPLFCYQLEAEPLPLTELPNTEALPWAKTTPLYRWRLPEWFDKSEQVQRTVRLRKGNVFPNKIEKSIRLQSESLADNLIPSTSNVVSPEPYWTKAFRDMDGSVEQYKISATFGLLAFSSLDSNSDATQSGLQDHHVDFESVRSRARRLVCGAANVSGLAFQHADLQFKTRDQLTVHLIPSISDDTLLCQRPPAVEITVHLSGDRAKDPWPLLQIKLLSGSRYVDLLMPKCHTDIRLQSYQVMRQQKAEKFEWRHIIQKFMTENNLWVWGSKLAAVPPEIVLPLPISPSGESTAKDVGSSTHVRYHVIDIDYESHFYASTAGFKTSYVKIASTGLDGSREKLKFDHTLPISTSVGARRRAFEAFYKYIIALAHQIRPKDYLRSTILRSQPAPLINKASTNRADAGQLLSELMRSTAVNENGTEDKARTKRSLTMDAVEEELDLLLGGQESVHTNR